MNQRSAYLPELLAEIPAGMVVSAVPPVQVTGIAIDSRLVEQGDLFVALRGAGVDGHSFIRDALNRGAAAVVGEVPIDLMGTSYVRLRDTREALTWIAAAFFGSPAKRLCVIGITGTDGKTTTANLIHRILLAAGKRAGLISTVNAVIGDRSLDTGLHVTTPDAHDVQRYLAEMVGAGLTHAVLETTSHGWAQHRIDACQFDIGVITNITHEHLDEHGSFANYLAAKARLIHSLPRTVRKTQGNPRLAVLNHDDQSFAYLDQQTAVGKVTFGLDTEADVVATDIRTESDGLTFVAQGRGLRVAIASRLLGRYNVSNCLAAICATVVGLGIDAEVAVRGIADLPGVPGRMQSIVMGQDFKAIVDFAHTPNALKVALESARDLIRGSQPSGRVIAVFGSAGLRDRQKRRMMAEIAARLADLTVLTAEDPRAESLEAILQDMAQGAVEHGAREYETYWRIPDRGEAIRFAVQLARAGDVVLACGKGHEQSMCFGRTEHPWDDATALRAALAERLGVPGPGMPYLPTRDQAEAEWLE